MDLTSHLKTVPEHEYHARSHQYLTSHQMIAFLRSPRYYHEAYRAGVFDTAPKAEAALYGSALHCLLLEGEEAYAERYRVHDGPINQSTGKPYGVNTTKYAEWRESLGYTPIPTRLDAELRMVRGSAMLNPLLYEILEDGVAEGVSEAEKNGVRLQARHDFVSKSRPAFLDLKTTADASSFAKQSLQYGYHWQAAFYWYVAQKSRGETIDVHLIDSVVVAVEKQPPYACTPYVVDWTDLVLMLDIIDEAVNMFAWCIENDEWPNVGRLCDVLPVDTNGADWLYQERENT